MIERGQQVPGGLAGHAGAAYVLPSTATARRPDGDGTVRC
jgi:hypothetical protein